MSSALPALTEVIVLVVVVLTCLVTVYATGHRVRMIQSRIAECKFRLSTLKRDNGEVYQGERNRLEKTLSKLEAGLSEAEQSSLFQIPKGASLSKQIKTSLPLIIGIIVGAVLGVIIVVSIPFMFLVLLFTTATFLGSSGLVLEFVGSERRALALSTIPGALYALTQILLYLGGEELFTSVFWLFDIVVVFALIGVAMIIGKELPLEIVIIIVAILAAWDIYAVIATNIMGTAVLALKYTLFAVLIPGGAAGFGLIGGGDLFFSYLFVTAFTRRLKTIPIALIGFITVALIGLFIAMQLLGLGFGPALPAVLAGGVLSVIYYRKKLKSLR